MKTTIDIADSLMAEAKRYVAESGMTSCELVEDALRRTLDARSDLRPYELPHMGVDGQGVQPGIDEGDWSAIRDLIYEGRGG